MAVTGDLGLFLPRGLNKVIRPSLAWTALERGLSGQRGTRHSCHIMMAGYIYKLWIIFSFGEFS